MDPGRQPPGGAAGGGRARLGGTEGGIVAAGGCGHAMQHHDDWVREEDAEEGPCNPGRPTGGEVTHFRGEGGEPVACERLYRPRR